MITTVLYVTLALAFLVIAACLIAWVIQREPAGHGQHATRRSLDLDWDELPCFQPDPALAVHPDVQAGTLHNPGLLDDIRTERTTNLPGPDSQVRTDASALGWSDAQRQTSHQSAGEPDREIRVGPSGSWRSPDTSQLDERGVEALSDHLPGPVPTSKNGRAGEPRNLAGPVEQGQGHRAGEPHHRDWTQRPLSVVRDGLAPWVEKALAGAKVGDTVIGPIHDNTPFGQWLEQVTGGDPWNGKGSSDEYTDWLFAGMAGAR